jgi:NitT/TauT family transport system substrate-binding protein
LNINPEKDVTILQVAPNLQLQALQAGQFDVLFTVDPYGTIGLKKGICFLLQPNPRSKNIVDPFWAAAASMSSDLAARKDVALRVYQAMAEAVDYIRDNEQSSKLILTKYTPLDTDIANSVGVYKYAKMGEIKDFSKIQDLADKMQKYGLLQKRMDTVSILLHENYFANYK